MGGAAALAVAAAIAAVGIVIAIAAAARLRERAGVPRGAPLASAAGPAQTYAERQAELDGLIDRAGREDFGGGRLQEACRYALAGGKRLRGVIVLETAAAARRGARWGRGKVDAAEAALAVEYLHAASLAVDDLPAFDNDATRRGRPALHAQWGAATAQMAAVALLAGAFQNLARQADAMRDAWGARGDAAGVRICSDVSRALGALGAAGGQHLDVAEEAATRAELGAGAAAEIAYRKTATFFEIAVVCGWIAGGGDFAGIPAARAAGRHVGTAFQIADDLGDMEKDAARRAAGRGGWNYAGEYGEACARGAVARHLREGWAILSAARLWSPIWGEIYEKVSAMQIPPAVSAMAAAPAPAAPAVSTMAAPAPSTMAAPAPPQGSARTSGGTP